MPPMDLPALEYALWGARARPLVVDARLVRRVIKHHRKLPGIRLQVPHARCYALRRDALLSMVSAAELGCDAAELPDEVILLARPDEHTRMQGADLDPLEQLWRYAFHARVHLAIDLRARVGALSDARLRERMHRVGEAEFDEIRRVLRQDDLLLPPYGALETYAEFAALYLELRHFAPALLPEVFPALGQLDGVDGLLAEDVDAARLVEDTRPAGIVGPPKGPAHLVREGPRPEAGCPMLSVTRRGAAPNVLRSVADDARRRGNLVRSALVRLHLAAGSKPPDAALQAEAQADLAVLARRLIQALRPSDGPDGADLADWERALYGVAEHAALRAGMLHRVEARLLHDVQRAVLAAERPVGKVDGVDWVLSRGRRPVMRMLPATRCIRVARALDAAVKKLDRLGTTADEKTQLEPLLMAARQRAEHNLRETLRPVIRAVLDGVGLRPINVPERVAQSKVVEELLDHVVARGYLGLGVLRDALARNSLKMADLAGVDELYNGDALLRADRRLASALDGVYRRGEVYLRALQKLSSLFFGTPAGRWLTRTLMVPFGASAVLLYGVELVAGELGALLHLIPHHHHLHVFSLERFAVLGGFFFGLIHSARVRQVSWAVWSAFTGGLHTVLVTVPRWILSRAIVRQVLDSRGALMVRRYLVKPAIPAMAMGLCVLLVHASLGTAITAAVAIFFVVNLALNSRRGMLLEEAVLDALVQSLRRLKHQLVPGLVRLVAEFFQRVTEVVERGLYAVDEWLRFHPGQSKLTLVGKAVASTLWFGIAYVVRIWINLLIEPTINPIKHFPWVTVAAKMLLPFTKPLATAVRDGLTRWVGKVLAAPLTGLTVPFLSGLFGFLAWELKENHKLYRATRPAALRPVPIGHHGETMAALLKPGFHSGTLPKLWAKLRRAAKKGSLAAERHKASMAAIEDAVEHFVEREMLALLAESPRWTGGPLQVERVELGSNRVRVAIARRAHRGPGKGTSAWIAFDEQSGWIVAGMHRVGFLDALSGDERVRFENALGGLYQRAGVDLVREQIEAALPGAPPYDVSSEGLVVWPGGSYTTELVYDLESPGECRPVVRGLPPADGNPRLDRTAILFQQHPIRWDAWVAAWSADVPWRVVTRMSLLPPVHRR